MGTLLNRMTMDEEAQEYSRFYLNSGVWNAIPELGIEVYHNLGRTIWLREYPDGTFSLHKPHILKMRRLDG